MAQGTTVRPPAVAGTFYPGSPVELAGTIDRLLASVPRHDGPCPKALIVPHAGYVYSGPIAASAFARLEPYADSIERIVLFGPAHRMFVPGIATPGADRLATPLGEVAVDALAGGLPANRDAHAREHCLEVMLPFVQKVTPKATIVPIIGSRGGPAQIGQLLEQLATGANTVIVISSDLSHYETYASAQAHDRATSDRILAKDSTLAGEDACGALGINGLLWLARERGYRIELIDLRNSGDTAGSRDQVVGYGAFAVYEAAR